MKMPDESSRSWLLRCPECGEYASVELGEDSEEGRVATARCPTGHPFTFQHHGQTVEMLGTSSDRG
jgi:hypothetical protein